MANANLFQTLKSKLLPAADTLNFEAGASYRMAPKHRLAQYAATGCLNDTYYAGAENQLETVMELAGEVDSRAASSAIQAGRKTISRSPWKAPQST